MRPLKTRDGLKYEHHLCFGAIFCKMVICLRCLPAVIVVASLRLQSRYQVSKSNFFLYVFADREIRIFGLKAGSEDQMSRALCVSLCRQILWSCTKLWQVTVTKTRYLCVRNLEDTLTLDQMTWGVRKVNALQVSTLPSTIHVGADRLSRGLYGVCNSVR